MSYLCSALILFIHSACVSVLGTGRRDGIGSKEIHFRDKIAPLLCYSCSADNTNFLLSVSITLDILRIALYFLLWFEACGRISGCRFTLVHLYFSTAPEGVLMLMFFPVLF